MAIESPTIEPSEHRAPFTGHPLSEAMLGHSRIRVGSIRFRPGTSAISAVDGSDAISEVSARVDFQPMGMGIAAGAKGHARSVRPIQQKVVAGMNERGVLPTSILPPCPFDGGAVPRFSGEQKGGPLHGGRQGGQSGPDREGAPVHQFSPEATGLIRRKLSATDHEEGQKKTRE